MGRRPIPALDKASLTSEEEDSFHSLGVSSRLSINEILFCNFSLLKLMGALLGVSMGSRLSEIVSDSSILEFICMEGKGLDNNFKMKVADITLNETWMG